MSNYSVELTELSEKDMEDFSNFMLEWQREQTNEAQDIANKLGISFETALLVQYLRTRSRWTQDAEDELVRRDKSGEDMPDIMSWP